MCRRIVVLWWCFFWHMLLKLHCWGHSNLKIKFAKANKIANLAKSIEETEFNSSSFVLFILGDNHCYSYKTMTSSSSMHSSSDNWAIFVEQSANIQASPNVSTTLLSTLSLRNSTRKNAHLLMHWKCCHSYRGGSHSQRLDWSLCVDLQIRCRH